MTTNHSRKSHKKEMLVFSLRRSILATVAAKYRVSLTIKLPSNALGLKHYTTLKSILSRIRSNLRSYRWSSNDQQGSILHWRSAKARNFSNS